MIGTVLNVIGILTGGAVGLVRRKPLSASRESYFKIVLAAFTVFYGLRLTWLSLNGSFLQLCKQLLILLVALALGRLTGQLLRLQEWSNQLGRKARERIESARADDPHRLSEGFKACGVLFCAAPLGILGAVQDGLSSYVWPLGIKAVMDGLATASLAQLFGWGTLLAALPVLAFQGTLTLLCALWLEPWLRSHGLLDSINAVGGLLVFCVALVMLQLKRIELANYLPSLVFAPFITWVLS